MSNPTIAPDYPFWEVDPDDDDPTYGSDFLAWAIDNHWPLKGEALEQLEYDDWWAIKAEEAA